MIAGRRNPRRPLGRFAQAGAWVRLAAVSTVALLQVATLSPAFAGGPPIPTEAPEYFNQIGYWSPGATAFEVHAWVQYARPDSLDLVRLAPRGALLPRLEAYVHPDLLVLQPRRTDPEWYRTSVPVGSPIACTYTLTLQPGPGVAHVVGPDYLCVWLGEALLAPLRPEKPPVEAGSIAALDTAAVDRAAGVARFWLEAQLPDHWHAYGPWPVHAKVFRAPTLADQLDNFLALGNWRAEEHIVAAAATAGAVAAASCTLQVALAGPSPVSDAAWRERAAREVSAAGITGRGLVCIAPSPGPLRVLPARRSWLVLWPADRGDLPPESTPLVPPADPSAPGSLPPRRPFDWGP